MPRPDGFRDQRLVVVPRPAVRIALGRPITRRLLVTDAGWYPHASGHEMRRTRGSRETIVAVCTAGSGWAQVGPAPHRVSPSTAFVIPAGVPHAYGADPARPWTIWWCHLAGSDVAELIEFMDVSTARPVLPVRSIERAVALLDEIVSGLQRGQSPMRLVAAAGAAFKLLTQLSVDRMSPEPGDPLERAMHYLEERRDGSVRVSDLARMVGVSPSHLSSLFRKATGGGVLAHHTGLKMARARQLLDVTDTTVADIAREVGYQDPFYFSRQFRRHHGMSPTGYRARDSA